MSKSLNYAKWDHIGDSDSEDEVMSPPTASTSDATQANKQYLAPSSATSKPSNFTPAKERYVDLASSVKVEAVRVPCELDKAQTEGKPFEIREISIDHPIFKSKPIPISISIGFPLLVFKEGTIYPERQPLDNQIATYLNIDLTSGFAPSEWQSYVGTIIVARADKKPLITQHVEAVWMYCDLILDRFGDGGIPTKLYNRDAFEKWFQKYRTERQEITKAVKSTPGDLDDWKDVETPHQTL